MRAVFFLCLMVVWPALAAAQNAPAERARAASDMLDAASARLEAADGARDRVRALTETVAAFEEGLSALRSGLRQAALREEQLSAQLHLQEAEIGALLAALLRARSPETPVLLLHPGGPTGTARAGMLLAEVTPALNARAEEVRRDYLELQQVQQVQTASAERLSQGLAEVQLARSTLNQAIAERSELPKRFTADPVREAILLSSAETLREFAANLDQISAGAVPASPVDLSRLKGQLPLPVQGRLLRRAQEPDAAGIVRPGIIVATLPRALVTSPVPATLRYVGPLLDFGQVMILEPQADVLFVLAGLETVYAETGDVIEAGAPLGLMGDARDKIAAELSTDGDDTGAERSETLYIEVRENNRPEDPATWFRTQKDG